MKTKVLILIAALFCCGTVLAQEEGDFSPFKNKFIVSLSTGFGPTFGNQDGEINQVISGSLGYGHWRLHQFFSLPQQTDRETSLGNKHFLRIKKYRITAIAFDFLQFQAANENLWCFLSAGISSRTAEIREGNTYERTYFNRNEFGGFFSARGEYLRGEIGSVFAELSLPFYFQDKSNVVFIVSGGVRFRI